MKTVKLTAEEIRTLEHYLYTNPCTATCVLDHMPRLPKLNSGVYNCNACKEDGMYICPLLRARDSILTKLGLQ